MAAAVPHLTVEVTAVVALAAAMATRRAQPDHLPGGRRKKKQQ